LVFPVPALLNQGPPGEVINNPGRIEIINPNGTNGCATIEPLIRVLKKVWGIQKRYQPKVLFVSHDVDLAILGVEDREVL